MNYSDYYTKYFNLYKLHPNSMVNNLQYINDNLDMIDEALHYADPSTAGVADVKVDGTSVVTNRIAEISLSNYATISQLSNYATISQLNNKQDKLIAGTNITIEDNVISATGGAGLQYWTETATRFYRSGIHTGVGGLDDYLKRSDNEIGHWQQGNGWFRCMVTRLKGTTRNVIMGYAYGTATRHPILTFASTSPLDFEWGWSDNTFYPPYGVSTWADKDTYPIPREGYDWYFGWGTGTVTYNDATWYILLIDTYTWAGGTAIKSEDGLTMFNHEWEDNPQSIGLTLLQTAHAVPYTTATTEIGTEDYVFKYSGDFETFASIDTDGNAVFKEIKTDAGTLTHQLSLKQNSMTAGNNIQINGDVISATDTTYSNFTGTDGVLDGSSGLVPAPATSDIDKYLKSDGTWATVSGGITYSDFVGATSSSSGTHGLVPAPLIADRDRYLKGDGTWATTPDTTYSAGTNIQITAGNIISATDTTYSDFSGSTHGLVPAASAGDSTKYLKGDGTWSTPSGGGSSVVPNPIGPATDLLNSIEIENVIYGLPSGGGGTETVEDLIDVQADWAKTTESSMSISWVNDEIVFSWSGGLTIGANIVKIAEIPSSVTKLRFKITTGTAYSTNIDRFRVFIGVRTTYQTGIILPYSSITDWLASDSFAITNSVWEDELDLSNVTVDTYLYITAHGWNATINKLEAVTISNVFEPVELTQANYNALSIAQKTNGKLYLTHDGGYDFIDYDSGKIIVRVNTTTNETIWFFNGYTKVQADIVVPAELVPYIPTQTYSGSVLMCWAWTDDTSTTRNGAIGFLYPGTANVKIRSWSNDYSTLMGGTFWGTLIIDGPQEQQTNYSSPTDGLSLLPNRVYYNNTLYAYSSMNNSSVIFADLYTASSEVAPASITLNDDITNYDVVVVNAYPPSGNISTLAIATNTYLVNSLITGCVIGAFAGSYNSWYYYTNSTTLTQYVTAGGYYIKSIVGIKY